jgi:hypothetical protein
MAFDDDFELKKKMFGGGPIKLTSWHCPEEVTTHLVQYNDIPVTIFITEYEPGHGVELYLQDKRMQGDRTIKLENKIIDYLTAGRLLNREYLLGELREAIAKTIDPACENAKALLYARWYDWHPGEEHPDGRDDMDDRGDPIRR